MSLAILKLALLEATYLPEAGAGVIEVAECVKASCKFGFWLRIEVTCMRLSDEEEESSLKYLGTK